MILEQILNDKGRNVITVGADSTLHVVAKVLDTQRIGAVVAIDGDGNLVGVLSERDIVRQVARHGEAALLLQVSETMTRDVVTMPTSESLDAALHLMTDRRIRHLPVTLDGEMVGVISIGDLVKWKIAGAEAEAEAMKSYLSAQY
ncbi:MAG: CBS domain-containing protein [Hyphomonas sp.]